MAPADPRDFIDRFARAACEGPGSRLARLFAEDGVYHDGFYGAFRGRDEIARMIDERFHAHASDLDWRFKDVCAAGDLAYGTYRFRYVSKLPGAEGRTVVFEGMGRFRFRDGGLAEYHEAFDSGVGMAQLGFPAGRIVRALERRAREVGEAPVL